MTRIAPVLLLLAAGCAAPKDGAPPSPPGSVPREAERDFILPASTETPCGDPPKD